MITSAQIEQYKSSLQPFAAGGRSSLLPVLLQTQKEFGYIPEEAAAAIAETLRLPKAEIQGVIEFYSMLYLEPTAPTVIRVCDSPVCKMLGSPAALEALCSYLGIQPGQVTADGQFMVEAVPCLGLCEHAPAALVNSTSAALEESEHPQSLLRAAPTLSRSPQGERWLTARCGQVDPASLADYTASGGFDALQKALAMPPEHVIAEIKASGLVGRGGAAFPTGLKMEGAAKAEGQPKYLVLNADESEPGTFKDRVLLEEDPFSVLEGMLISAYGIGARYGYAYVRGEYPHAQAVLSHAIETLYANGYLGKDILGSGFSFDIELRSGAGAYICGEETALFESIEGKRGFPRIKPPFPTTHGLFGKPTVINNVETFCNLPLILRQGADWYRSLGTSKSPGLKLFCLSGDVRQPGLYEFPFGMSLRELIYTHAGGMRAEQPLQAVLLGGAAGMFLRPDELDVRLTFEDLRAAGLALGSGAVMVFDQSRDLRQVLADLAHFFAHESCGKCYPCQLGTQRQLEVMERCAAGKPLPGDRERLLDVGWTMTDASLCGLGQTAAMAILSAAERWPHLLNV